MEGSFNKEFCANGTILHVETKIALLDEKETRHSKLSMALF